MNDSSAPSPLVILYLEKLKKFNVNDTFIQFAVSTHYELHGDGVRKEHLVGGGH